MQTFEGHVDIDAEVAVKLKFENELDYKLRKALAEDLVAQLMNSKEFHIVKQNLTPTASNPFANFIRFYARLNISNATF